MQPTLGKPITADEQRDAIHVAIAPVIAAEKLAPGQDVGFVEEGNTERVGVSDNPVGIIDPFLNSMVFAEQRVWMLLYPNTVTGMRHQWEHPAFEKQAVSESITWLTDFASEFNMSLDEIIDAGHRWIDRGEYTRLGFETPDRVYSDSREFWKHFEIVTGAQVEDDDKEGMFFTCAC